MLITLLGYSMQPAEHMKSDCYLFLNSANNLIIYNTNMTLAQKKACDNVILLLAEYLNMKLIIILYLSGE